MRVFPNGFGYLFLLLVALGTAWILPTGLHVKSNWPTHAIIVVIFIAQGFNLNSEVVKSEFSNFRSHALIQLAVPCVPLGLVGISWASGIIEDNHLGSFLILACLPTTISTCVVYSQGAGGDPLFAAGVAGFSNILSLLFFPLVCSVLPQIGIHNPVAVETFIRAGFIDLLVLVFFPFLAGTLLRRRFENRFVKKWNWWAGNLPFLGVLSLAHLSLVKALHHFGHERCAQEGLNWMIPMCFAFWALSIVSWILSGWMKLRVEQRVAVFFCLSQKSLATGAPLILLLLGGRETDAFFLVFPLIVYHVVQLFFGAAIMSAIKAKCIK